MPVTETAPPTCEQFPTSASAPDTITLLDDRTHCPSRNNWPVDTFSDPPWIESTLLDPTLTFAPLVTSAPPPSTDTLLLASDTPSPDTTTVPDPFTISIGLNDEPGAASVSCPADTVHSTLDDKATLAAITTDAAAPDTNTWPKLPASVPLTMYEPWLNWSVPLLIVIDELESNHPPPFSCR